MARRNRLHLIIIFLFAGISAFSQERIVQRFSWEHDEYASAYEARVERRDDAGVFTEIERKLTNDDFVEFSLSAGFYRYRVQAYDLLDRPAGNPPWIFLEIIPALRPELLDINPKQLYLDEEGVLVISGRNFGLGARIYLELRGSPGDQEQITPREFIPAGSGGGRLVFGSAQLKEGIYDVHIQNPGGLSSSRGPLNIVPRPVEPAPVEKPLEAAAPIEQASS